MKDVCLFLLNIGHLFASSSNKQSSLLVKFLCSPAEVREEVNYHIQKQISKFLVIQCYTFAFIVVKIKNVYPDNVNDP